jgi:hypothetical protein
VKRGSATILIGAARLHAPLILLFAMALLATHAPGSGVGFVSALAFGLALALHALVFGAAALRAALPPPLMRLLLATGIVAALVAAGLPRWALSAQAIEAGVAVATASAAGMIITSLFGRAPNLRDVDW